jgi:tRNA/tmRNA/rRNA uracil-C5-methylase (TrmA/RlmC/RlmD family)
MWEGAGMSNVELVLGGPAAGGGFVAHDDTGRVVFVRHGLPGERVVAELTEEHPTWARADAIEILETSDLRVAAPCPYAGAGRCGGCDYQHVGIDEQRGFKRLLLAEQLRRVAGLDLEVDVEAVGDGTGLGTRTRVRFGVTADGDLAMRHHRSHELQAVDRCALAVDRISALGLSGFDWPPGADVEAAWLGGSAAPTVTIELDEDAIVDAEEIGSRLERLGCVHEQVTVVDGQTYRVPMGVFWQVHELAASTLVGAVLTGLELVPGDRVLDLYCGAGLFTRAAALRVGSTGTAVGIEASRAAVEGARTNLADLPWASAVASRVDARSIARHGAGATHAVFDPPRRGVDRGALAALDAISSLRRIVSVSCDAATFARDLRMLLDAGWSLVGIRALDLFEMTEHAETVAVLER